MKPEIIQFMKNRIILFAALAGFAVDRWGARRVLFWCATWPKVGHFFQKIIDIGNRKIGLLRLEILADGRIKIYLRAWILPL